MIKKNILFIVHSQIDTTFLIPIMQILAKDHKITLETLENYSVDKLDDINRRMLEEVKNLKYINNTKIYFLINYALKKIFRKNFKLLRKIFVGLNFKKYINFDLIITDFSLGANSSPFLKKEILSLVKIKHGFVHSIAVSNSLKIENYNSARVKMLCNNFSHIYYGDSTWKDFLEKSGVENIKFFPSIKFSKYYSHKILSSIEKNSKVFSLKDNTKYKNFVLYIDTRITGNELKTKEIADEFKYLLNRNRTTLFMLKVKPREYTSISNYLSNNFSNLVIIHDKYSVEELIYICDLVIGRISSTLIFGSCMSKIILLFSQYRYAGTELVVDINDCSLTDLYNKKLNKVSNKNINKFMSKNKLDKDKYFYIKALKDIV